MAASERVTRGHGLLERFLAQRRRVMAERLIPETARSGRLLDIGCGSYPLFLSATRFAEKYGIDRVAGPDSVARFAEQGVVLTIHDLDVSPSLPFADGYFDAVTMLAVFEHIEPKALVPLMTEIKRTLKPGGVCVLTTPNAGTEGILKVLSKLRLVSSEEIDEHKDSYTRGAVCETLRAGGFCEEGIESGLFELGANIWARART